MKSRTLMEVFQSPPRKPFQQSPESTSCFRAAVPLMVLLPVVVCRAALRVDIASLRLSRLSSRLRLQVLIHVKAGYHPLLINLITMKHCEPRSRLPLSDRLSAGHSADPPEPILEPHEMTCRPKYKAIGAAEGDQCHRYDLKPKKV